jgi:GTPase
MAHVPGLWASSRNHSFRRMNELPRAGIEETDFKAGFCAIIGLPNVGKSTILNRLIGERLSIVTAKAQTTRQRLLGIYSDESHQSVFVDTPGLLKPRYALHESMQAEAERATLDADVLLYVVDLGWKASLDHAREFDVPARIPSVLCLNKMDRASKEDVAAAEASLAGSGNWRHVVRTEATMGTGTELLLRSILDLLPASPPLYPVDEIATAPLRFFAAELIRETCFEELAEEVPYATAVGIEAFREEADPVYIDARIYVERESQKGIVIGRGGAMIKKIGSQARVKIERLMERPVYLDLRVKVMPNWRRRPGSLKLFGYDLPPGSR